MGGMGGMGGYGAPMQQQRAPTPAPARALGLAQF